MKGKLFLAAIALLAANAFAAYYQLEIIQPREGLDTSNRFYKAYPGLEYNVRPGVIGGEYPFTYSLDAAPAGMTIDENKGTITWPSPTTSGSPHLVSVKVTDQEGSIDARTWTITVTTSGFKFVDASAGNDAGAGTIDNPWKALPKIASAAASDFIYFRGGNYASDQHQDWPGHLAAVVWLAYPGETPVFDLRLGTFFFMGATNRLYIDGLTINSNNNAVQRGFSYAGGQDNVTFRRNTFYGMKGVSGDNPSYLFCTGASYNQNTNYVVVQDNVVTGGEKTSLYLAYSENKLLIEDNNVSGLTDGKGMNIKDGNGMVFIRGNVITLAGCPIARQSYTAKGEQGPVIIEYNNLHNTTGGEAINVGLWSMINQPLIVKRNTVRGRFYIRTTATDNGPCTFSKNVIINNNDAGHTDRIRFVNDNGTPTITYDDNLVGGTSENIVDANGMLTAAYSQYAGTHGHYVDGVTALAKPVAQQIRITRTAGLAQAYDVLGRKIQAALPSSFLSQGRGIVFVRNQDPRILLRVH